MPVDLRWCGWAQALMLGRVPVGMRMDASGCACLWICGDGWHQGVVVMSWVGVSCGVAGFVGDGVRVGVGGW